MKLLRLACLLLVVVNIVLFTWGMGYLGGGPRAGAEPQRLAQQLSPERIRILGAIDSPATAAAGNQTAR
ncbi:MAG: hypothetical protein AUK49_03450 [Betaproteobacteria bacterium CG2_30_68_42]|nr:MAG: hypothetical protein AUK49_03450 [Betaproteobacteria bacterium CG2_30_68_42]PIX74825.1 MAG: hypothetical protein COZ38_08785 [Rhodocyclales bacterium CG_4_10_14_3_um_filter_68_10]PJA58824.1 MAG: hypothetical protein CO164_00250 [Rhodocyclales bacterium CG_4_9_14_3_um_filter_68_10]